MRVMPVRLLLGRLTVAVHAETGLTTCRCSGLEKEAACQDGGCVVGMFAYVYEVGCLLAALLKFDGINALPAAVNFVRNSSGWAPPVGVF